jgi:hypothetical protein
MTVELDKELAKRLKKHLADEMCGWTPEGAVNEMIETYLAAYPFTSPADICVHAGECMHWKDVARWKEEQP